jgi:hypothetical protein
MIEMNRLGSTLATMMAVGMMAAMIPTPLFAHEGHGFSGTIDSVLHWLSSPYHIVLVAAIVAVAVAIPLGARRLAERSRTDVARWS